MAANVDKKLLRSKSGLRIVPKNENNRSPFELSEPPWLADYECIKCISCHARFDFIKRRHHCRRCGKIFCSSCCDTKLLLPRMCFIDPVRVCRICGDITKKENEFYDKHLKALLSGAHFHISSAATRSENENVTFFCKLSIDHRQITFDGGSDANHDPLDLPSIQSINIIKSVDDYQGNAYFSGLHILYLDRHSESQEMKLTSTQRKETSAWIVALNKGVKMMKESRDIDYT